MERKGHRTTVEDMGMERRRGHCTRRKLGEGEEGASH